MALDWNSLDIHARGDDKYIDPMQSLIVDVQKASVNTNAIQSSKDFLFTPLYDFHDWGDRASALFLQWRESSGYRLSYVLDAIIEHLDVPHDAPLVQPAMVATILAEMQNLTPFHNNHHFHEVTNVVVRLADVHNDIPHRVGERLTPHDILLLYIAACIHDFAHDGIGNVVDGVHTPSRVERRSLDRAKPYLQEAGLSNEDWIKIEILVICTDVSGDTSEIPSPASIAREIYMGKSSEVDSFYKPLSENPKLSVMVTLLQEADLAMSSGLNYKFSMEMTRLIAEETKVLTPSASTLYGFMHYICHGGYLSTAGNFLLGDNFQSILLEAENDKEKGVLYA